MRGSAWLCALVLTFALASEGLAANNCSLLMRALHGVAPEEFLSQSGLNPDEALDSPIVLNLFDFDDNVAHIDSSRIFAKRWADETEVALTTQEYAQARNDMGKVGTEWEGVHFYDYVILPGQEPRLITLEERYEIQSQIGQEGPYKDAKIVDGSWWHFRDVPDARIFDQHLQAAVTSEAHWQAPAFFSFAVALSDPSTAEWTGILTTRGHRPESFARAIQSELVDRGFVRNNVRKELVFPIYSPDFPDSFGGRPHERKAEVLMSLMDMLEGLALKNPRDRHRIVYSEDDQKTISHARELIQEGLSEGRWTRVEIEIQNTDYNNAGYETLSPPSQVYSAARDEITEALKVALRNRDLEGRFVIPENEAKEIADELGLTMNELLIELIPIASQYADPEISKYFVGVAGLGESGDVYLGVNLEFKGHHLNHTVHGEQFLLMLMLLHGETGLKTLALSAEPCGHCRQFLYEMEAGENLELLVPGKEARLLPEVLVSPFGPKDLGLESGLLTHSSAELEFDEPTDDPLLEAARLAAEKSYAPYTKSHSGVAFQMSDGSVVTGSYIENAAFNPSLAAFQGALVKMLSEGGHIAGIERVVLVETANPLSSALPSGRELFATLRQDIEIEQSLVHSKK